MRPKLKYASAAWDPHLNKDVASLEMWNQYVPSRRIAIDVQQDLGRDTLEQDFAWDTLEQDLR